MQLSSTENKILRQKQGNNNFSDWFFSDEYNVNPIARALLARVQGFSRILSTVVIHSTLLSKHFGKSCCSRVPNLLLSRTFGILAWSCCPVGSGGDIVKIVYANTERDDILILLLSNRQLDYFDGIATGQFGLLDDDDNNDRRRAISKGTITIKFVWFLVLPR